MVVYWRYVFTDGFMVSFCFYSFKEEKKFNPDSDFKELLDMAWNTSWNGWSYRYVRFNFAGYMLKCLEYHENSNIKLTEEDKIFIRRRLSSKKNVINSSTSIPDNLIIIVVESFPAKLVESEIAPKVIPTISRLLADSTAFYIPCKVIIGPGNSSSAQFVYNTGLLPLRDEALVLNYAINDYPSIAKARTWRSLEVIGENGGMWHHFQTSKSYGYEKLVEGIAPYGENQDSLIFKEGIRQLRDFDTPFFLFLTTMTMHLPYDGRGVTHTLPENSLSTDIYEEIEYYNRANHFDRQLEYFLGELKKIDRYDRTLIVIVGDHSIPGSAGVESLRDDRVPFIVLNSPLVPKMDRAVQTDVFPSIFDMLNINYMFKGIPYRGVGNSIFSDSPHSTPTDLDYKVSEMIIKGDF